MHATVERKQNKVAAQFFRSLRKQNYEDAISHFDKRVFRKVTRKEMREALERKTVAGELEQHHCSEQKASVRSVKLECKTTYGPVHFTEKLSLVKGSKGWKIFSYRYDSNEAKK